MKRDMKTLYEAPLAEVIVLSMEFDFLEGTIVKEGATILNYEETEDL